MSYGNGICPLAPGVGLLAVAVLDLARRAGGPSELVDFISDVKVNISKLTRDHTLSPRIASLFALGWTDLSPQQAFQ